MTASVARHHSDWLSLIEVSGPFLTVPVLQRALPQGLEPVEPDLAGEGRRAHDEWRDDPDLHGAWIRWVITSLLGFDDEMLLEGPAMPPSLTYTAAEHGETLRPNLALREPTDDQSVVPRLLVTIWPEDVRLDERLADRRWSVTPLERMSDLLKATGVRLGLVTNGERWSLVHAPASGPTAYASWDADLWLEERSTLDAFTTFLSARRFFGVSDTDTLEALLNESANAEQEVTDQLGRQVRQAVELLVDAFGRADREHQGTLLAGIEPHEVYLAAVTMMMRLVFLLSAEERGLFLLGDPIYDSSYAVSTLRSQLQEDADRFGEEPLERRSSAWYRVLGTFRLVYAGVQHENLRLPAYGGSLFDPDRFPFLEGRVSGDLWRADPGRPLPVDDRTVLHILDALQVLRFRIGRGVSEARRLSFRALDVEQIGHVYEGLLDHTAVRVTDPAVGLDGKLEAEIALEELEKHAKGDRTAFSTWLAEVTGRTAKAAEKALNMPLEPHHKAQLLAACDNDQQLADRVAPFHGLLRKDLRALPQVYVASSVYVTKAGERRSSGTYYTPRSLAEEVVEHALAPLVYDPGPAEGADPGDWELKSPAELLDLKVCDMAMGSGAFLVAAARYLADRLVEAWALAGSALITAKGKAADGSEEAIPGDPDDQLILARRLVADRCIYGVDKNPMAVEMAKLSMWLITLAKDRPFSFLDHALRPGDSLLGIHELAQIEHLHPDPERGRELHTTLEEPWHAWQAAVQEAIERRRELESFTVVTVRDASLKERLFREAEEALGELKVVGDVIVGAVLSTARHGKDKLDSRLLSLAGDVAGALEPTRKKEDRLVRLENLRTDALYWLNEGKPSMQPDRRPFHWPLEFPEVFVDGGGFDAVVMNPPFLGGRRITAPLGLDYRTTLVEWVARGTRAPNADLCSYFLLRAAGMLRPVGYIGTLATDAIAEGDTRENGLDLIAEDGYTIFRANRSQPWPGTAAQWISELWIHAGSWQGQRLLDGLQVSLITPSLHAATNGSPSGLHRLAANAGQAMKGSHPLGEGFLLTEQEARRLISASSRNQDVVFPYLIGRDLNTDSAQRPSRWIINFQEMSETQARTYSECWQLLEDRVLPERMTRDAKRYPRMVYEWWKFWNSRASLYEKIRAYRRVIVTAQTGKHIVPILVPAHYAFDQKVIVFTYDDYFHLASLTSAFHWLWVVTHGATLGQTPSYSTSDCFETFPMPEFDQTAANAAELIDHRRQDLMFERDEGLTKTYNRFHNPGEAAADVVELRQLHVALDYAVAAAYDWGDLQLDHAFHETPQGLRYTLGPVSRVEVLDRLLELNHERYREEEAAGLHAKKEATSRKRLPLNTDQESLEGTT